MNRRTLLWTVYPYYLVIILGSLALTAWYASDQMTRLYFDETTSALETRAQLVERQVLRFMIQDDRVSIQRLSSELGALSETRITVIGADGTVLGDSDQDPAVMESHGSRPEIATAFGGVTGVETRYSNTLQRTMMYVAIPVRVNGNIIGAVRTSQSFTAVQQALDELYRRFLIGGVIIALLATVVSYLVFRRLTRPLRELQIGAERFSRGDLQVRLAAPEIVEIAALAEAMNLMAGQLDSRIGTVAQQRNEREAILSSMFDGVIALDAGERITSINRAAAELFGTDHDRAVGLPLYEVARSPVLRDLIGQAADAVDVAEAEFIINNPDERHLQAHATALMNNHGDRVGTVLVFTDITRLKRLERMRRDFVANVSHELKTPITAISGSVETLADGAIDSREDSRKFLEMIARHSSRLGHLVDDLLSLARLEAEIDRGEIPLERGSIKQVLNSAAQACSQQAADRRVNLEVECPDDLQADLHTSLMQQAITNLVDNAIKYSDSDTSVTIRAYARAGRTVIEVEDRGCGIEPQHLPRLFERFYRVDTARSRETGGTGLGLAIVKHITLAHHGSLDIVSTPGRGSTFRLYLPSPL
jgi:two-component system phosphate regulon sensor histidine kinase PhoR